MAAGIGLLLAAGCRPEPAHPGPDVWFADETVAHGLDFVHDAGPVGNYLLPQIMGSGGGLFDYDNDGRLDLLLLQNGGPQSSVSHRLFHQEVDGTFRDASVGSGLDLNGQGMGVAAGDADNDGFVDLLLTEYGALRLMQNRGDGRFDDVSDQAGIASLQWATSAAFIDYDRDGWLDLVVVNYLHYDPAVDCRNPLGEQDYCSPSAFAGSAARLFHNVTARARSQGDHHGGAGPIAFEDVSIAAGLGLKPAPGLGVLCADFDGDHWPDVLVANDGKPNFLWINRHDGTFDEQAAVRGLACNAAGLAEANMGIAAGDVDGRFSVFITHLRQETNTLWQMTAPGLFSDRTVTSGLANPRLRATGFGTVLADFDNDGLLDLAIANGGVRRTQPGHVAPLENFWEQYEERNQCFRGLPGGRFQELSDQEPALCGHPAVWRAAACGDVDNDGGLDLLLTTCAGRARLLFNRLPNRGHWLIVRARDPDQHRDAYGAEIELEAGGVRLRRWINPAYSYLCSSDPRAHFGLGAADRVAGIRVVWPDGFEEQFPACSADALVELRRGTGQPAARRPSADEIEQP